MLSIWNNCVAQSQTRTYLTPKPLRGGEPGYIEPSRRALRERKGRKVQLLYRQTPDLVRVCSSCRDEGDQDRTSRSMQMCAGTQRPHLLIRWSCAAFCNSLSQDTRYKDGASINEKQEHSISGMASQCHSGLCHFINWFFFLPGVSPIDVFMESDHICSQPSFCKAEPAKPLSSLMRQTLHSPDHSSNPYLHLLQSEWTELMTSCTQYFSGGLTRAL